MKLIVKLIILCISLGIFNVVLAQEIALYDYKGDAVAYIDTDNEMTIYLWEGKPVAYLKRNKSIYGFNGKHLGWLENGIIVDHNGYATGFIKGAISKLTNLESLKGLKELTPLKSLEELEPLKPLQKNKWARIPLKYFLLNGI